MPAVSVCRAELRPRHADHPQPLVVHLDVPADRFFGTEQRRLRAFAEHRHRRGALVLAFVEEAPRREPQVADRNVGRRDAVHRRHIALRLRQHLRRLEALARRRRAHPFHRRADDAVVLERQPWRRAPHLSERLRIGRLARLDDDVAHAELLDERHHLLLRAGANRQHRDDGRDAEDHAEHRQQRAQLVDAEVVEPELQILKPGAELRLRIAKKCRDHEPALGCTGPALPAPVFASASGFRSATSVPTVRLVTTMCVSVRCDTFTSRGSNERP